MEEFDENGRPLTFVACLENLINWLDLTDPIVNLVFPNVATGRGVQEDLQRLANALRDDPMTDYLLMDMIRNG